MKMHHRSPKLVGLTVFITLGLVVAGTSHAYLEDSFESYTNGASVIGVNGWMGDTESTIIETLDYSGSYVGGTLPLPAAAHTKVLKLDSNAGVSNAVTTPATTTNWLDLVINPIAWTEDTAPTVPADAQLAAYINSNGNLVIYHGVIDLVLWTLNSNTWTEIAGTSVSTSDWIRVSVEMDHNSVDVIATYYRLLLNGTAVTNALGYSSPNFYATFAPDGGEWFPMAIAATQVNGLLVTGDGYLDDVVVTNATPVFGAGSWTLGTSAGAGGTITPAGPVSVADGDSTNFWVRSDNFYYINTIVSTRDGTLYTALDQGLSETNVAWANVTENGTLSATFGMLTTSNAVPWTWLDSVDPSWTNNAEASAADDQDGDGMTTEDEWLASTHPNISNSVFQISEIGDLAGQKYVEWISYLTDTNLPPFGVMRTSNLVSGAWELVDGNVTRATGAGDGPFTNTWLETEAPDPTVPFVYSIVATNSP